MTPAYCSDTCNHNPCNRQWGNLSDRSRRPPGVASDVGHLGIVPVEPDEPIDNTVVQSPNAVTVVNDRGFNSAFVSVNKCQHFTSAIVITRAFYSHDISPVFSKINRSRQVRNLPTYTAPSVPSFVCCKSLILLGRTPGQKMIARKLTHVCQLNDATILCNNNILQDANLGSPEN